VDLEVSNTSWLLDRGFLSRLTRAQRKGTLLLITADHGGIATPPGRPSPGRPPSAARHALTALWVRAALLSYTRAESPRRGRDLSARFLELRVRHPDGRAGSEQRPVGSRTGVRTRRPTAWATWSAWPAAVATWPGRRPAQDRGAAWRAFRRKRCCAADRRAPGRLAVSDDGAGWYGGLEARLKRIAEMGERLIAQVLHEARPGAESGCW